MYLPLVWIPWIPHPRLQSELGFSIFIFLTSVSSFFELHMYQRLRANCLWLPPIFGTIFLTGFNNVRRFFVTNTDLITLFIFMEFYIFKIFKKLAWDRYAVNTVNTLRKVSNDVPSYLLSLFSMWNDLTSEHPLNLTGWKFNESSVHTMKVF